MDYKILSEIKSPKDIKGLDKKQTELLCDEIRDCIINTVSKNGGHLASNLGTVELTVALHRAFNSPEDEIIFDVGHQSYTHKLLTGRFSQFHTIRQKDGISGYMKPSESEHDPFITGHSSNSISAAYGIYKAKRLKGENGTAVAVIGDGAMTGGMAYEALNNAGAEKGNFIVVLNDNEMSISENVGAMARAFTKMRNKPRYQNLKINVAKIALSIPKIGESVYKVLYSIKDAVKRMVYGRNVFSALGFSYLGPVDGHKVADMEYLFTVAAQNDRPTIVHVITTKGKGYSHAETSPQHYHGVSPFDIDLGAEQSGKRNFSAVAGETLCEMAEEDNRICAVTAAMAEGTGLEAFAKKYPDRFFDVGIAEQHAVTFSAALAKKGLKPYFAVYSSFLQRGFDQVIHDAAIGGFPLKLLVDRAGIVGEDGETHQGLFDVSFLTSIPGVSIYSPSGYDELKYRIKYINDADGISVVRYPRGGEKPSVIDDYKSDYSVIGSGKTAIVTYGRLFSEAVDAIKELKDISLVKLNKIYPLSDELIETVAGFDRVYFFEESEKSGGIAESMAARLLEYGYKGEYHIHAVENRFVAHAEPSQAINDCGLDSKSINKILREVK